MKKFTLAWVLVLLALSSGATTYAQWPEWLEKREAYNERVRQTPPRNGPALERSSGFLPEIAPELSSPDTFLPPATSGDRFGNPHFLSPNEEYPAYAIP